MFLKVYELDELREKKKLGNEQCVFSTVDDCEITPIILALIYMETELLFLTSILTGQIPS